MIINITKIYLVTNIDNNPNKVYIGKTKNSRENNHKKTFGDNITYNIIEEINSLDKEQWKPLENKWIKHYINLGYNVVNKNMGGGGPSYYNEIQKIKMRKPRKEGTGNNISKALKGRIISKEWNIKRSNSKMKSVIQYDMNNNFIKEWSSIKEAGNSLNIDRGSINNCCLEKKYKSVGGFIRKYK